MSCIAMSSLYLYFTFIIVLQCTLFNLYETLFVIRSFLVVFPMSGRWARSVPASRENDSRQNWFYRLSRLLGWAVCVCVWMNVCMCLRACKYVCVNATRGKLLVFRLITIYIELITIYPSKMQNLRSRSFCFPRKNKIPNLKIPTYAFWGPHRDISFFCKFKL